MKVYSPEEIKNSLNNIHGWEFKNGSIVKTYNTNNFARTMALTAGIGALCQQYDHHPDYLVMKYSSVEVAFSTHSAGGITDKDIEIAIAIENLGI